MKVAPALLLCFLISFPAASQAQSLDEIVRREHAVFDAWTKTPITVRRAVFVVEGARGYGMYDERPNNVFKPGEKLHMYAEPVGYGWKEKSKGIFEFGFDIGFVVKDAKGKILGGNENFSHSTLTSHERAREFMLNLDLSVTGVPDGDYVVEWQIRDVTGSKTGKFELPFQIKA